MTALAFGKEIAVSALDAVGKDDRRLATSTTRTQTVTSSS